MKESKINKFLIISILMSALFVGSVVYGTTTATKLEEKLDVTIKQNEKVREDLQNQIDKAKTEIIERTAQEAVLQEQVEAHTARIDGLVSEVETLTSENNALKVENDELKK